MAERRQVIDFPEKRLWVTEHQIEEKCCPVCLRTSRAAFPEPVKARAQYGPHLQALGVYLVQSQLLPYGRASQLLREVLGLQISAGSLVQWVRTCAASLGEVETRLKESLKKASVIHQDETSLRAQEHQSWVHVCSTEHSDLWRRARKYPSILFARRKTGKATNDAMPPKVRMLASDGMWVFEPSQHGHPWAQKWANLQPMYQEKMRI